MIDIRKVEVGKSYACKFKVEHILDEYDRIPGLSDKIGRASCRERV